MKIDTGIIGGSGLYSMPGFEVAEEVQLETPFGSPSDAFVVGTLSGQKVVFLARHGRGHRISPSELNYRANIWGMKKLGVERIVSLSAVGSLKQEHEPLHFVLPDQFFDRTMGRKSTFFGEGLVAHVSFAEPTCHHLTDVVFAACQKVGVVAKKGGTYLCMEGPAFSTKAESHVYRSWGMDVIGMTNLTEAKLAREAEICYCSVSMVTDYDCWHEGGDVDIADVLRVMAANAGVARNTIVKLVKSLPKERPASPLDTVLDTAIITPHDAWEPAALARLDAVMARVVPRTAGK